MSILGVVGVLQKGNFRFVVRTNDMSSEKIMVNGSLIEKDYFEENLQEAKRYKWKQMPKAETEDHNHCIVCMASLPGNRSNIVYASKNVFVCSYCFEHFLTK